MRNVTVIDDVEISGIVIFADGTEQDIRDVDFGALIMEELSRNADTTSLNAFLTTCTL